MSGTPSVSSDAFLCLSQAGSQALLKPMSQVRILLGHYSIWDSIWVTE